MTTCTHSTINRTNTGTWYCSSCGAALGSVDDPFNKLREVEAERAAFAKVMSDEIDLQKQWCDEWQRKAVALEADNAALRKLLRSAKEALGDWDWEDGSDEQHTHYCSKCDNSIDGNRKVRDAIDAAVAKHKP